MTGRTLLAALIVGASPAFAADIGAPDFYDNSAYTLTKVDAAGDNTITKFEYNTATQTFEPVFYRVDLKQTEFGKGALSEEFQIPVLGKDITIKFNYDDASTGNYEHVYKDITKDLGTVTNADIPEDREIIKIGGAVEIDSDTVENAIFQNNTTTGGSRVSGENSTDLAVSVSFKGGALYNDKNLNKINADFIGNANEAKKLSGIYVGVTSNGGAIYNDINGTIGEINGNFINNYTTNYGSAIYNAGKINNINGTFYNTSASDSYSASAIYNDGEIGNIASYFLNNQGSALSNSGTIETVQSTFIGNSSTALGNGGRIVNINSDFIGNDTGISNRGHIGTITGNFLGNNVGIYNSSGANIDAIRGNFIGSEGSAIYNPYSGSTNIGTIESNFVDNSATRGGAIYNDVDRATDANGAIYIQNISSNFINNRAEYSGGAIYNSRGSLISQISNSLFLENTASQGGAIANTENSYYGGIGIINKITDTQFINNSAQSDRDPALGGAIYNHTTIGETTSIGSILSRDTITYEKTVLINSETGESITGYGVTQIDGAYTRLTPEQLQEYIAAGKKVLRCNNIQLSPDSEWFEQEKAYLENDIARGVYSTVPVEIPEANIFTNDDVIANINTTTAAISNSVFIGNYAKSKSGDALGGAIYNDGTIGGKVSDLQGLPEYRKSYYVDIDFDKLAESIPANRASIENSSFYNNYAESETGNAKGGAIYTTGMQLEEDASTLHISAKDGGESVFSGNYTVSNGVKTPNAIYLDVSPEIEIQDQLVSIDTTSVTTADITTKAVPTLILDASTNGVIQFDDPIDGAQGTTETVTTTADLNVAEWYQDNYGSTVEEFLESVKTIKPYWYDEDMTDNEILTEAYKEGYLLGTNEQSTTETSNYTGYSLNITGDDTGKVILNNDVTAHTYDADGKETGLAPVNISLENTNLYLGARDDIFDGNNLNLKSGFMSMVNNSAGISALNNLTVSGDVNFAADVDLANQEMDRFTAADYGEHTGNINVVGMNILSDAPEGRDTTEIFFAETGLMDNVVNGTGELPDSNYQVALTPIYKYNVGYETREDDGGYFVFTRGDKIPTTPGGSTGGGSTGNPSDAFNPAVLTTPVGNLAAGQAAMNEAFKYVFEHADAFTQLPSMERYAKINANKYALSTDFNENLPSYTEQLHNNAVWFRPYTTFETMNIKNGPKVDAITYGSLVGFDGDFKEMKNGWSRVFTGYAGYMGSSLNYSGVDTTMNGGLLGFTETFYKGNFWTAITASAGASVGESHTMYGKEDYTSLLAGVGSKTGYNFEFKDGKFIIQPIMFLSYTFVNTFDYKNAAGVNIESDPLHTIQLNPSVRFIANLKGGWQPYASVGMVWNLMNESKVTANNVKLPEMSVKPYVEYGVGVQRNWADKFTAFLQAMIRNGGRNGIALTGGFRFMLGSDDKDNDKPKVKKEIKSL